MSINSSITFEKGDHPAKKVQTFHDIGFGCLFRYSGSNVIRIKIAPTTSICVGGRSTLQLQHDAKGDEVISVDAKITWWDTL